jgi:hypothetical protein
VAVRVDRLGGRVHVAVVGQVGLDRADQVGRVLLVVADQRCHGVVEEAAHLLRVAGQHPEQQPVGALADLRPRGPAARRRHAQHQLGLLERPAGLGRPAAIRRQPDLRVAPQPCRGAPRGVRRPGQQRVDLVLHNLRERAGQLGGDRRHQAARAAAVGVRAERHEPARQVASQPGRAPLHVGRIEIRPRQQLLQERAAQGLLGLVPGLHHGHLGQGRDRGHVQVLAGVRASRAEQQHRPELTPARRDRHLRRHVGRALWAPAGQAGAHITLVACPPLKGDPQTGHDHGHRRAGVRGGDLRHALQPVPGQHGAHHLQVGAARRLRQVVGDWPKQGPH